MTTTTSTAIRKLEKLEVFAKDHRHIIAEMLLGDEHGQIANAWEIFRDRSLVGRRESPCAAST